MNRWALKAMLISGASALAAPHSAYAQEEALYDIAPQPLDSALVAFASRAHASLALPDQDLSAVRSPGVRGRFRAEEALGRLLAGADYGFVALGDNAFRIVPAPRREARAPLAPAIASEQVIVTAARRRTPLAEVPRSLADIDGERLDLLAIRDGPDMASQTSGVLYTDIGAGRNKMYIRGVSDGAVAGRAQSTVGIYLDGVRLTYAAPDPQLQLVDIARVDILRGPQGALYGAGSIGGIFSIETNPPDPMRFAGDVSIAVESTQNGGVGHNGEVVLNVPLIADRAALRLAAYSNEQAGWLSSPARGRSDVNDMRRNGARLGALVQLSPDWSARAFVTSQLIDNADASYLTSSPEGFSRSSRLAEPNDNDFLLYGAALHGRTSLGRVDSTLARVRHEIDSRYDATGTFTALGVASDTLAPMDDDTTLDIIVHETRLSAPDSARVPWFLGVFLADGDARASRRLIAGANDGAPLAYQEQRRDAIDEAAIFGEASWKLTPDWTLSTGMRLFQLRINTRSELSEDLLALSSQSAGRKTTRGAAPDIRLSYQPNANAVFYVAASEGYRSGGFNTGEPVGTALTADVQPFRMYQGDELWSYEAGARLTLFDGRALISSAVFYNDWRKIQTDSLIVGGLPYTGNVGDGRTLGWEADLVLAPSDRLTLRLHSLFSAPNLTRLDPSFTAQQDDSVPGAPEILMSGSARYERPLLMRGGEVRFYGEINGEFVGAATSGFGLEGTRDSYSLINLSLGAATDWLDASVYVRNLLGAEGQTFSLGNPYASAGPLFTRLRPTTIGFEVTKHF